MEGVISLYTEEEDPNLPRPYVCFDETSKQRRWPGIGASRP